MNAYRAQIILLIISASFSAIALAKDDCNSRPGMQDMYICFNEQFMASDMRVNELYRKMIKTIPKEYREMLERSQNTWLAYRDAQCEFLSAAADPRSYTPCRLQMNEERERLLTEEMNKECNGCIPYKK